jgi:phage gp37-like protein
MLITELIQRLEELKKQAGDILVEVRNASGDFDDAGAAELVNVSRRPAETKWRVFIDV